jgi:hypothetical protein
MRAKPSNAPVYEVHINLHSHWQGVCTVSDDESALHRAIVKLTWTTGPSILCHLQWSSTWPLVPRRRRACACSAWQTRLGWGLHLQSDSTLALERTSQRTLHLESDHFGPNCPNIDTMHPGYDVSAAKTASAGPEWSQQLTVHSSGNVSDSGSIFPSVVFRAANHRDLEAACCCWLVASAAEEWNGWRLIHVRQIQQQAA